MSDNKLKWGSPEWRTHLRRSLAQRRRHGEKIDDIEGLINYIEEKGPSTEERTSKPKPKKTNSVVRASGRKIVTANPSEATPNEMGLFGGVTVLKGR